MDLRAITLLAFGHVADDVNQSFLPALLPLLVAERHLTLQAAGTLVLAQTFSSSVIQPAIGYIADKKAMPWMAGLGLLLAGGGVAGIGFMPTYELIFLCALISGVGVAMFHPEAARFANLASGTRKASGMRWFAVGGNIGFAAGPVFATLAIAALHIQGTVLAAIPVLIMAALLLRESARLRTFVVPKGTGRHSARLPDDWSAFARLTAFIMVRSTLYIGLVTFIPLYLVDVAHAPIGVANMVLTTVLVSGIAGTIAGGSLADKYGYRSVIYAAMIASVTFVFVFAQVTNLPGVWSIVAGFVCAVPLGMAVSASQPATIVLGQDYLPNRLGVASGVTLGLAVSVGGAFTPILGHIGDVWGTHASILAIGGLSVISLLIGFTMPDPVKRRAKLAARTEAIVA
jgi:FSR family fosmidomycin resistance protein-like MFS transporter